MGVRNYIRSFAGGIISPEMYGRIDTAQFQSGAKAITNMIVRPQGSAFRRPGFQFVAETKAITTTRLVRFRRIDDEESDTLIEMGVGYMRFYVGGVQQEVSGVAAWSNATNYVVGDLAASGGVNYYCILAHINQAPPNATYWYPLTGSIYEIPTPYAAGDLFDITYTQSADVMTFAHSTYEVLELRRFGATNWTITPLTFTPSLGIPGSVSVTSDRGQTYLIINLTLNSGTSYIFTGKHGVVSRDVIYIEGVAGLTNSADYNGKFFTVEYFDENHFFIRNIDDGDVIVPVGAYTGSSGSFWVTDLGSDNSQSYVITALDELGTESRPSSPVTATNNLFVAGASNSITWDDVDGASRYHVYKEKSGVYGFIGKVDDDGSATFTFEDDNIGPDLSISVPLIDGSLDASDHPGAVGYFEGRRFFAATATAPQDVWGTVSNTESDLSFHLPVQDSDRIYFRLSARDVSRVRHIVPMQHLVLLTSSSEMRVTPLNSDALTPGNVSVRPQSHIGASFVQPIVVNNTVVFESARGGHIRELGFSADHNGFVTGDLSLRAPHLFDYKTIVDLTYMKSPLPVLWMVNSSGTLIGFTYAPEEALGAWHTHTTNGTFTSCCAVSEGNEDRLYTIIQRGSKVTIQRMGPINPANPADRIYLDDSQSATTGLSRLNGVEVQLLGDFATVETLTVSGGTVTPTGTYSVKFVGLPYTSEIETLPASMQVEAYAQGRTKNINKVWVRIIEDFPITGQPLRFQAGPDEAGLVTHTPTVPLGEVNQVELITLSPLWGDDGTFLIRQGEPFPLAIASITYEVAVGS